MNKVQRIRSIIAAVFMLLAAAIMMAYPQVGISLIALFISIGLYIKAFRTLVYYFTMARHMVGGSTMLYRDIITFDLAMFTWALVMSPGFYAVLYLLGGHIFSGTVDILRAMEARGQGDTHWKREAFFGMINAALGVVALVCGIVAGSPNIVVYIYCAGLIYSALHKIRVALFQRSKMVYIQ